MLTPEARRARHVSYNNRHTNTIVLLTFHKAVLLMLCIEGKNVYAFSFFFSIRVSYVATTASCLSQRNSSTFPFT